MFPATPVSGRFETGRVIGRVFDVVGRNFVPFSVTALVFAGLPALIVGWYQTQATASQDSFVAAGLGLLALPVSLIGSALLQAVIIHGTVSDLNGRRITIAEGLTTAVRLMFPLIGLAIVVGILTVLAALLFIVPGIIVAVVYSVAIPAEVVERRGVSASMSRSADLTRGNRWAIFGLGLIYFVAAFILGMLSASLAAVAGMAQLSALVITPIVQSVATLFGAAGVASIYYELRFIRDGVGLEALAAVFD